MRTILLSKITADHRRNFHNDTDDSEEYGEPTAPETQPVRVNVEAIRCFYPRKDNRPGTRITFTDGGGFAVAEAFDTVAAMTEPEAVSTETPRSAPRPRALPSASVVAEHGWDGTPTASA